MADRDKVRKFTRRGVIAGLGAGGMGFAKWANRALAQDRAAPGKPGVIRCLDVQSLKAEPSLGEGHWVETLGFHRPGDGGAALYQVQTFTDGLDVNEADVIAMDNGMAAVLQERTSVNYWMFGALGDGENDDGVQIKLAHEYANQNRVPVIQRSGEFWIKRAKGIPIKTGVQWGGTIFHVDERFNDKSVPRFIVQNDSPEVDLTGNKELCRTLVEKLKPGVQLIEELASYANHLLIVQDTNDRIGIRAGYKGNRGWAKEELFYVEEEGRILGDIAWEFKDLTSVKALPCNDSYLVIEGGGFRFSGDTPESDSRGYYHNGISVQRSRTIIREQWMGLEEGRRDRSLEPRHGLYVLRNVFDVTLENIRAMPWEKGRRPPEKAVQHGTYGIGGARMLNCTFRNLTAEAGWIAWGVFGTNLNKNFRLEGCRLNRVDVHFHCWNLHISDCTIGFKGISVTGGGNLTVENTVRQGNDFIHFRPDYGAKWDGPIRIRRCTLQPSGAHGIALLSMRPGRLDYQYPIGFGTSVSIEDFRIDYTSSPGSDGPCWLMDIAEFSEIDQENRLFFPQRLFFRNIWVEGREKGVRLLRVRDPYHYDLRRSGGCDESRLQPNCMIVCEQVQLEKLVLETPEDTSRFHLLLGREDGDAYQDDRALFPKIVFRDCEGVVLHLSNCAASVFFERCFINTVYAVELQGELNFMDCRLQPEVEQEGKRFYALESTLGTRFTHCILHAPVVNDQVKPELVNRLGFVEINDSLRHDHLNTSLGNEVVKYFKEQGIPIESAFVAMLKSRHALETSP